ncbi:MAG: hypothetical protein ACLRLO_17170, partial [Enterocloster sp.]|uniref:hypothetical protein n=1 Tax=Enterocloster sp. TaxID=2719315 RepID=UPI00399EF315
FGILIFLHFHSGLKMSHFALFYYILEGKRIGEPDKNMGSNIRKRNDFSKHQQILDLDHREVKFHFYIK